MKPTDFFRRAFGMHLLALSVACVGLGSNLAAADALKLNLQKRVETKAGSGEFRVVWRHVIGRVLLTDLDVVGPFHRGEIGDLIDLF